MTIESVDRIEQEIERLWELASMAEYEGRFTDADIATTRAYEMTELLIRNADSPEDILFMPDDL